MIEWLARVAGFLRGRRNRSTDLDDEMRFHLEMTETELRRRGMSPERAHQAARARFGGTSQIAEAYGDQRTLPRVESLLQDVRYAIRTLRGAPGFTLAALLTLALGIGANVAIFSVVDAVLLRPLPYHEPERLVRVVRRYGSEDGQSLTGRRFLFLEEHARTLSAIAANRGPVGLNLATGDTAEFVRALPVSRTYFDVLGVAPVWGSGFTLDHDRPGGPAAAILGHALWQRAFGGDPAVVGRSIQLGGKSYAVVGVMPARLTTVPDADLFVPLQPSTTGPGGGFNYRVMARLAPSVSIDQANAELESVWSALRSAFPAELTPRTGERTAAVVSYQEALSRDVRPTLLMILGAVSLLLLIACANTANLLLARATGRRREIAVRAALGASRLRIARQLLTESVLLSVAGAAVGVAIAYWLTPVILALAPAGFTNGQPVTIDARVLSATLAVAVVTGLIFGLAPALTLSAARPADAFKEGSSRSGGSRRAAWLRSALVIGEVAVCVMLLVGAGLFLQTFIRLRVLDPGFEARGVLTARMSLQGDRYVSADDVNAFFARGLERLRSIPGVRSAAVVNGVPIEPGLNLGVDILDGPAPVDDRLTDWRYASDGYFETMGIPVVSGRGFTADDRRGAPLVAVVNESFANAFFAGSSAIGRHIKVFDSDGAIEIVGVAKDIREAGLKGPLPRLMYVPVTQAQAGIRTSHTYFPMSWVVRAERPGIALEQQIRAALRALDPRQPLSSFSTMDEIKMDAAAGERMQMALVTAFAAVGLLLAAAGIYGVVAYSVGQRTREIGVRIALGATRGRILAQIVRHGALLGVAGVAVGSLGAIIVARSLEGFVWGVSTLDPLTFAAVPPLLVAVSIVASLIPALRTVRLDPIAALRE